MSRLLDWPGPARGQRYEIQEQWRNVASWLQGVWQRWHPECEGEWPIIEAERDVLRFRVYIKIKSSLGLEAVHLDQEAIEDGDTSPPALLRHWASQRTCPDWLRAEFSRYALEQAEAMGVE